MGRIKRFGYLGIGMLAWKVGRPLIMRRLRRRGGKRS